MPISLVPFTKELLALALTGDDALAAGFGCDVAAGWNVFPEALPLATVREKGATTPYFGTYFFVQNHPRTVVGMGGFHGPPSSEGAVEIGYCIAPLLRARGYATSAARALAIVAFEYGARAVVATTLAEPGPSTRVLEKLGFRRGSQGAEALVEAGTPLWRFVLERDQLVHCAE